jgi:D-alanyl-D-alanine carboxypeptidase
LRYLGDDKGVGLRLQTRIPYRIKIIHTALNIPRDYASRGLPYHPEAKELVTVSCGLLDERRRMTPDTRTQWLLMSAAARNDGIALHVQEAYRSVWQQTKTCCRWWWNAKDWQSDRELMLSRLAAPGFSEHHTGRALDIASSDCFFCMPEFEQSPAFRWLCDHAARFGFHMTYPRDNRYGVMFEPWHWCFRPRGVAAE